VQVNGLWYMQKEAVKNQNDWNVQSIPLPGDEWCRLSSKTALPGEDVAAPDLRKVAAIGFATPVKSQGSTSCIRLDWFELLQSHAPAHPAKSGFLEPSAPSSGVPASSQTGKSPSIANRESAGAMRAHQRKVDPRRICLQVHQ